MMSKPMNFRVAFCGASGTGKTTLSNFISTEYGLLMNPVGSRSVSTAMGFASPYDVDKAGKRAEFQRRLVIEKSAWEDANGSFVTDRTTLDNLVYTMFHDIAAIDDELYEQVKQGMARYTHIIYCPVGVFCNPAGDPSRVADMTYHRLYDQVIWAMVQNHHIRNGQVLARCLDDKLEHRRSWLRTILEK
jgi:AAA domain